jgi:hypothetical protein
VDIVPGLEALLTEQPNLHLAPLTDRNLRVVGEYLLCATNPLAGDVSRTFQLIIEIPLDFPARPPKVFEVGDAIPSDSDFHVNGHDCSLCLGTHIGLQRVLRRWPNLQQFLERTLRPFLYAVSIKLDRGGPFLFGELKHGVAGTLQDLASDLGIDEAQLPRAIDLLMFSENEMLSEECLCGCGRLLRDCEFGERFLEIRSLAGPDWFGDLRRSLYQNDDPRVG